MRYAPRICRLAAASAGWIVALGATSSTLAAEKASNKIDFQTQVAPILRQSCVDCHGPLLQMAGLRLDQRQLALEGGDSGESIVPGSSEQSLLVQRLTDRKQGILMPPSFPVFPGEKGGLPAEQIAILKNWIDQGAAWPEGVSLAEAPESSDEARKAKALLAAIRAGDRDAVEKMIADASLLQVKDAEGSTTLMHAALYADARMLRLLLDRGADVNAANRAGVTALMWAAGDSEKARLLLEKGAKVDARTPLGRTPLLIAATYAGNVDVVRLLLEKGAKAADQDVARETALTSAAKRGDVQLVEALIEAGADVNAGGRPALVWAAEEGNAECLACLLKHDAGKEQRTLNAALFSAATRGPVDAVRLLLEHGADPNAAAGFAGYTPLMGAAYSESNAPAAVRLLLDKGADVNKKGANGETALSLARKRGRTEVVEMLEKAGATQ